MVPRNAEVSTNMLNTTLPTRGFPATLTGVGSARVSMEGGQIKARIACFTGPDAMTTGHVDLDTQHVLLPKSKKRAP